METDELLDKIRQQTLQYAPPNVTKSMGRIPYETTFMPTVVEKPSFSEITPYKESSVYKTLSSGERVGMFENFIPGTDNEERLAQAQTTSEKWANGTTKFFKKTANAVVGGTAGLVYGVGSALTDGNMSSIYDNKFSNWLNDLDTKDNYQLANHYTKQEQDLGLLGQIGTANFWSDKFLGGLSFTAGALISEGLWAWATGGTSLATSGARWGTKLARLGKWGVEGVEDTAKVIDGMSKYKTFLKSVPGQMYKSGAVSKDLALGLAKAGELTSVGTFMARSAGYEASVEALQFKKEAEEKFYSNFQNLNGREPNAQDIAEFNKNLKASADGVFGFNMAILAPSNLITMGHILDIKNPIKTGLADFIDRKAFGYGLEKTAEGTFKAIERTSAQKLARNIFNYGVKPGVTEGIFEEGLQGVTQKFANKWIDFSYDPNHTNETFDNAGAFYESLGDQYGTKQGWVEVGLGVLIGIAGSSVNARSENKAKAEELEFKKSAANTFNDTTLQSFILPHRVQTANRIAGFSASAIENEKKGNLVKSKLDTDSGQLSFINSQLILGESINDMVSTVKNATDLVTAEQWKESGIDSENIEAYKAEKISDFKELATQWKKNKSYVQYMVGNKLVGEQNLKDTALEEVFGKFNTNANIVEALAWQLTLGERGAKLMEDSREAFANEIGQENTKILDTVERLKTEQSISDKELKELQAKNKAFIKEREKLKKQVLKSQKLESTDAQKSQYNDVATRLIEVEEAINQNTLRAQELAEALNINTTNSTAFSEMNKDISEISFNRENVSADDILNLDDNIKKFNESLENYKKTNPQKSQYLEDLSREYLDARDVFLAAQATHKVLVSPDFKMKNISSWIGGKIHAKKAMNQNTKEWLEESLKLYAKSKQSTLSDAQTQEIISNEDFANFTDTGEISEEILKNIAEKVKNRQELSQREDAVYKEKSFEIEKIIKEDLTKTRPKETALKNPLSNAEELKQEIENQLKNVYKDLLPLGEDYEGVSDKKPTQEEIEEYRKGSKDEALKKKMGYWKLLNTAINEDYISIGQMIDLVNQLENTIEQEDTVVEVTESEAFTELKEEDSVGDGSSFKPENLINQNAPATVKINKDQGTFEITHIKPKTIVDRLGGEYTTKKNKNIDSLVKGDWFEIDGMRVNILDGGRLSFKQKDFKSREDSLNMKITATDAVKWTFIDLYSEQGLDQPAVKTPSDFQENIKENKAYSLKKGDTLSLHIDSTDNWNETRGDNEEQLKIYLKDKDGDNVQVLRANSASENEVVNPNFLKIRQLAYQRWVENGKPKKLDLGIEVEVDNVFLGSPEFNIVNRQLTDLEIPKEAIDKVIIAKGYIENGEVTLDNEIKDVDLTYTKRLSMKDNGKKRPIIVFKRGAYNIAFPVTLSKQSQPVDFDSAFSMGLNDREIILELNKRIIENNIETDKLVYGDINNDEKLAKTREAFQNKTVTVSASTLAQKNYSKDNLNRDAKIKIDLTNVEQVINAPKIRINLNSLKVTTTKDLRNDNLTDVENKLNDLANELYRDYIDNAATKYLNSKGEIIEDTTYTDAFDEKDISITDVQLNKIENINTLKQAFSQKIPKSLQQIIGADKIKAVKDLLNQYDFIKSQIIVKNEDLSTGDKNSRC